MASPLLPRQGWLFLIEFLKWYFSKYWQVRTRPVFAQTVTYIPIGQHADLHIANYHAASQCANFAHYIASWL